MRKLLAFMLLSALAVLLAEGIGVFLTSTDDREPEPSDIDPYVLRELDGFYLGDRFVHDWLFGGSETVGGLADMQKQRGIGEGTEHLFASFGWDELVVVEVRDYKNARLAPSLERLVNDERISESDIVSVGAVDGVVYDQPLLPGDDWTGRAVEYTMRRFRVKVIAMTSVAAVNDDAPSDLMTVRAVDVATMQGELLPDWADEEWTTSDLRLPAVTRSALFLLAGYATVWLIGASRGWLARTRTRLQRTTIREGDDRLRFVDRQVHRVKWASRTTNLLGLAGFTIAVAIDWWANDQFAFLRHLPGPFPKSEVLWILGWLVGLSLGRRFTIRRLQGRADGYRQPTVSAGWPGAIGAAISLTLVVVTSYLVSWSSSILTVGYVPSGSDATTARRLAILLVLFAAVVLSQVSVVYRWVQRHVRMRSKSIVADDRRQSILLLRSFSDDTVRVGTRRTARRLPVRVLNATVPRPSERDRGLVTMASRACHRNRRTREAHDAAGAGTRVLLGHRLANCGPGPRFGSPHCCYHGRAIPGRALGTLAAARAGHAGQDARALPANAPPRVRSTVSISSRGPRSSSGVGGCCFPRGQSR